MLSSCSGQKQQAPALSQLATITVKPEKADIYTSKPATIKGALDTEIRPKVGGFITELLVDEGSIVKKGQLLFKIDQVTYRGRSGRPGQRQGRRSERCEHQTRFREQTETV